MAMNPTDPLAVPDPIQVATLDEIQRNRKVNIERLKVALVDMHKQVTEDLLRHEAHNHEGHVVDSLLAARCNAQEKRHEVKVHWRGLAKDEDSWEPAAVLLQDVPVAVKAFVKAHRKDESVDVLGKALGLSLD
ncbi:Hypothetical protein PHPALM_17724 [Phytophthora palmivora]|uniref:Chromo domain-containing protein n=1 Tax=Phytophthora palmivora TaxID=4796 RepID=A0A2P4XLK0_9STRA|nr:Hypothetical protein PHPALM_17724 [Phytophthora palmivora]